MNFDLVAAMIAAIRGSPVGAALGGRIYEARQVPPNALFPRCYISLRRSPNYQRYALPDGGVNRHQYVEVLFAHSSAESAQAIKLIEGWDAAAIPLLQTITSRAVPDLVYLVRIGDLANNPDENDLTSFPTGGGLYDAYFQHG